MIPSDNMELALLRDRSLDRELLLLQRKFEHDLEMQRQRIRLEGDKRIEAEQRKREAERQKHEERMAFLRLEADYTLKIGEMGERTGSLPPRWVTLKRKIDDV